LHIHPRASSLLPTNPHHPGLYHLHRERNRCHEQTMSCMLAIHSFPQHVLSVLLVPLRLSFICDRCSLSTRLGSIPVSSLEPSSLGLATFAFAGSPYVLPPM
jgi:hypothetical protein